MFFSKNKPLVGLDIGSSSVKAVELAKSKSGYEVVGFGRESLGPDAVVDGAVADAGLVSEAIKAAFSAGGFKAKHVATGVSGHSVIVKRVVLPVDNADEVAASIEFDADQYIPFEIAEVNLDYEVIGPSESGDEEGLEVLLVAAKKDQIQNNTDVITMAGRAIQIPVQTNVNNTISTQYQDFSLSLTVLPQITEAGTILLTLSIVNSSPDFGRSVNNIPSVSTQQASTTVMIPDGGTAVIGGILLDNDSVTVSQVPGLGNIPVLGHLFKSTQVIKSTSELLFFVTARIRPANPLEFLLNPEAEPTPATAPARSPEGQKR